MEKIPSDHFINQSLKSFPQIPGLRCWYPSIKFDQEKKLKELGVFNVIGVKGEWSVFIGKFLQILFFRSIFIVKT